MGIVAFCGSFGQLFAGFGGCFVDGRSFENFVTLTTGWILCAGRHTLTNCIRAGIKGGENRHHSAFYRFVSRAKWDPVELGHLVFKLLLAYLPQRIDAPVDDTLLRRSGPHLFGAAMHYDAARSSYGRFGARARKVLSFGHDWVTVSVWVPYPWNPQRGVAVPVLWGLYRPAKKCKPEEYRKRTEIAADLILILLSWLPQDRTLHLSGDSGYACKTVVRALPKNAHFVGPMPKNAALYAPALDYKGRGTRRVLCGERMASPGEIIAFDDWPWRKRTFRLYGQSVTILFKHQQCLWYTVAGQRRVKMVVTRDPCGRWQDRAYFSTDPNESVESILCRFSRRWTLEQTYRDVKEVLGIDEPQNGWWRRWHRRPDVAPAPKPGPNPHPERGREAALRTAPLGFVTFGLVVAWYLRHGQAPADVARVQSRSPWYQAKREPCFSDMLRAARRELWTARIHADPRYHAGSSELTDTLLEQLLAA